MELILVVVELLVFSFLIGFAGAAGVKFFSFIMDRRKSRRQSRNYK